MEGPILDLRNVGKHFARLWAVSGISFAVRKGQIVALLGPSGCGKTTILRMIAGFLAPDTGAIRIGGRDMAGVPPYRRNIGLVFQDYALFPHLTVEQNIAYGLRQRGYSQDELAARVRAMIELVRLRAFETYRPAALSGGQQQRVALARALAIAPELMLLDEPLSALDAKLRQELRFELKHILLAANCTALIVTHDQEEAMSLADHVIVMHHGRILQEGAPATVYAAPQSRAVAEFIGRANWFDGRLGGIIDGYREYFSADGRLLIADRPELTDRPCDLCVRPERLVILDADRPNGRLNVINGSLETVAHLGAEIHYEVRLASGRSVLVFEQNRDQPIPHIGTKLRLGFRPSDGVLVLKDTPTPN
jgi:putative spermidine/putrescine transport system ATP-binding protein/putrescine transport system ATP-binding protein